MKCYLLLDRTGSMSDKWAETLSAVNGYVKDLAKQDVSADVTLAMFDKQNGFQFDVIRRSVDVKAWQPVLETAAFPRGWTPLYDAIGQIAAMAEEDNPERAVLVVMTDGAENSSTEITREKARAVLDRCRARDWQVVFLGVAFDNFEQSAGLGVSPAQTMASPAQHVGAMAEATAALAADYSRSGARMAFSAGMRRRARETEITGRK
jgi:hypothetical protein